MTVIRRTSPLGDLVSLRSDGDAKTLSAKTGTANGEPRG